jgi:hypothetical protein
LGVEDEDGVDAVDDCFENPEAFCDAKFENASYPLLLD